MKPRHHAKPVMTVAQATKEDNMEREWIEWDGYGCPDIDPHKVIEVRFRDGSTDASSAGVWHLAFEWRSYPEQYPEDVVAYRETDWRPADVPL